MMPTNRYKEHKSGNKTFFEINSHLLTKNTILIKFDVGSIHDPKTKEGLSHLVEHLLLHVDEKDTAHIVREKKGLFINAFTEKEKTTYIASSYILSTEETIEELLKSLNFDIKKEIITKEVDVILAEILQDKTDPVAVVFDKAMTECVKKHNLLSQYRHNILGTEESLKNISINDIQKHIKTYYVNSSISVTSSKSLSPFAIKSIFDSINRRGLRFESVKEEKISQKKLESSLFQFTNKNTQVYGICINNSDGRREDIYLSVLKGYLAYNWSSVCNQKMRLEKQLTYFVNNYYQIFNNFCVLYIQYDVSKKNAGLAKKEYLKIVKDLQKGKIDKDIFEASKSMLLSSIYDSLGNEEKVCDDFLFFNQLQSLKNNDLYTIENFIESVKKLNLEDFTKYVIDIY